MEFEAHSEAQPLTAEQEAKLHALAVERAAEALRELELTNDELDRFYKLPGAAIGAFQLGDGARAKALAEESLRIAPSYVDDWNYGNALHFGHTVLGLLALQVGDTAAAVDALMKSGDMPGSPQLDTFGPSMQLAKALGRVGEFAPVLAYLQLCRRFWKMSGPWLDLWEAKVRQGVVPTCLLHAFRQ